MLFNIYEQQYKDSSYYQTSDSVITGETGDMMMDYTTPTKTATTTDTDDDCGCGCAGTCGDHKIKWWMYVLGAVALVVGFLAARKLFPKLFQK